MKSPGWHGMHECNKKCFSYQFTNLDAGDITYPFQSITYKCMDSTYYRIYTCALTDMHTRAHTQVCVSPCASAHVCVHSTYMSMCAHTHTHTHTHDTHTHDTHAHTYTQTHTDTHTPDEVILIIDCSNSSFLSSFT